MLKADAGFRFVWAAHALLDLSDRATLHIRDGASTRLFPEAAPLLDRAWPQGAAWVEGSWPAPCGLRLDQLGPDDGTAVGAVVDAAHCCVHDQADRLSLALEADGQPVSIALWRNLGGFPAGTPTAARASNPCSAASSTSPRRAPATLPGYPLGRGAVAADTDRELPLCLNRPALNRPV